MRSSASHLRTTASGWSTAGRGARASGDGLRGPARPPRRGRRPRRRPSSRRARRAQTPSTTLTLSNGDTTSPVGSPSRRISSRLPQCQVGVDFNYWDRARRRSGGDARLVPPEWVQPTNEEWPKGLLWARCGPKRRPSIGRRIGSRRRGDACRDRSGPTSAECVNVVDGVLMLPKASVTLLTASTPRLDVPSPGNDNAEGVPVPVSSP